MMKKGMIFDIQHYCVHDGPGVRTNVFLKGCPLRCRWCQNPESQQRNSEVLYRNERCTGCGVCVDSCPMDAIQIVKNKSVTDRHKCNGCGRCVELCPSDTRNMAGSLVSIQEVLDEVLQDKLFYETTGGGVTLSGGEVLLQSEFAAGLLQACKEQNIHTTIETCGMGSWESFSDILKFTDLVLYDVKVMEGELHQRYTGADNRYIMENLKRISNQLQIPVIVRTPVITGVNDTEENMREMALFLKNNVSTLIEVNLLPYHNLGESKKAQLDRSDIFEVSVPTKEKMQCLLEVLQSVGIKAV